MQRIFSVGLAMVACTACERGRTTTPPASESAVAFVAARYADHFIGAPGLSRINRLKATQTWFTPRLYTLLLNDVAGDSARGGVGYLNWDPFTGAQDIVDSFRVDSATPAHDTVVVHVAILVAKPFVPRDSVTRMRVAVTSVDGQWRIANFTLDSTDVARGLVQFALDEARADSIERARRRRP